jgi:hypothetical protein
METPSTQLKALDLQRRMAAGENIPLSELREFILFSNQTLEGQRKQREKPTDVEFF